MQAAEIGVDHRGRLGLLTLNRPQALNALTFDMTVTLDAAFRDFAQCDAIDAVLIRSSGSRAFCAGGDVVSLATAPRGPALDKARRKFFAREYALNYLIHNYPKPVLALIDGITMGGGCGLSMHASHRIATERTLVAMPEVMIGFFPDVGATWFLNRLPGRMGIYIGLTALRLRSGDLRALGLATHHMPASTADALVAALAAAERLDSETIDAVLAGFASEPGTVIAAPRQRRVNALFAGATVADIMAALATAPEDWAREAHDAMRQAAPTSLDVTLRHLRGSVGLTRRDMFRAEYRLAVRLTDRDDFREGVRARLIDKDNAPRWQPARIEEVDPDAIDALFAPLAPDEPELDLT